MKFLLVSLFFLGCVLGNSEHPRLLFPKSMEQMIQERIKQDPVAAQIQKSILERANLQLKRRTCEYRIPDGVRLLAESRNALDTILNCAWAWRTTGEVQYKERVIKELDAACKMKDWHPAHFLDTAEMATAVSIGYDWLFPVLTDDQRKRYADALWEKAIVPVGNFKQWWSSGRGMNNWSQVCATGISFAAELLRERDLERCEGLLKKADEIIHKSERFYVPDGVYPEGTGYWAYGTQYHVLYLAAQESLGKKIKYSLPLIRSGEFILQMIGPSNVVFNFSDSGASLWASVPAQNWLASRQEGKNQRALVREQLQQYLNSGRVKNARQGSRRFWPLSLLWLPPSAERISLPLTEIFTGQQAVASLRTGYSSNAVWIAAKGGTGILPHGHMDVGSFVYETGGVRWFHHLGADNYNLPGYWDRKGKRWEYLRMTNLSHNTLVIDGKNQALPEKGCPIKALPKEGEKDSIEINLSGAYSKQAKEVIRQISLDHSTGITECYDVIKEPVGNVRWAVVTNAKVNIDNKQAILEKDGKKLVMERKDDSGGKWEILSLKPKSEAENQNKGWHLVAVTAPPAAEVKLQVAWGLVD